MVRTSLPGEDVMILRRLKRHVSDQNWFAVAIEFLIVVIGVAAGFQLTGYYDESKRRSIETSYLEGIADDYAIYQELLLCRVDGEAAIAASLVDLIHEIDGAELTPAERRAVISSLPMSHVVQPGLVMEGNTSALIGGDLVAMISDSVLRGRILAAQSIGTASVGSLNQIERAYYTIDPITPYTTRHWDDSIRYFVATDYDIGAMRQAPGLRDALMDLANLHQSARTSHQILLDAVDAVLERLVDMGVRDAPQAPATCPYDLSLRDSEPAQSSRPE